MAVDKSFVVKNGLEVNSDLIVADASSKKVGIASTGPRSTLDVRGGIAATDGNFTGILTAATLDVTNFGAINATSANITGFSTLGGVSVDQLTVTGVATFADLSYDEITGRNLNITGIATVPVFVGVTSFNDGVTVSGVVTASQFIGAGQIGIGTSGGLVGYGVSFLDFRGPGFTTAQFNSAVGIVTLNFQGGGGSGSASIGVGSTPGDAFTGIITSGNLWYNTGLGRLFIYYQDDNSAQWVDAAPFNVGIITQLTSVAFSTGSVAAPSLSFGNDSNTGFFAPADGSVSFGSNAVGIVTFNSTGVLATTYFGDGSNLTGIDATSLKDDGGNVKAQANPGGVVITGVATATTFVGDLTGDVTGNADTATTATTATNAQGLTGTPDITVNNVTGAAATFSGSVNANSFTGDGSGLTGVANTDFIVGTSITMTSGNFTGNVTIGGTLTYQDVESIDSIGIITAQQGIQILANGLNVVSGVATVGIITGVTSVGGGVYYGDGSQLTGISVGITTESITATDQSIATLNLSKDAHKVSVSGVATIDCQGGSEYGTHILTIENTGIATVGFSTYFLFPSGSEPSLPTASGAISQLSFTVHRVGAAGTQVLTTAALNFS